MRYLEQLATSILETVFYVPLNFLWCGNSSKLVILFVVIAAAVIVLGLRGIVSVVYSQRVQDIHVRPYEGCNMALILGILI